MSSRKLTFLATALLGLFLLNPLPAADTALSLGEALQKARERNPVLQRQLLEQVRREAEAREARSALLPALQAQASETRHSLNYEAMAGRPQPDAPVIGPFSVRSFSARAQMPLLDLSLWRRWQGSKSLADSGKAESDRMGEEISALVVGQYLAALRSEAQVRAVQARIELAKALENLAAHQEQSGVGTGLDTLRAKLRTRTEEQALVRAHSARQEALSGIVRLLDLPPDSELRIKELPASEPGTATSPRDDLEAAHVARADFRVLEAQSRAADERVGSVRAQYWPSIQAFASLERMGLVKTSLEQVYEVGVQVKVPLYTGGRIEAQVSQARAARSQVDASRRELEARVGFELRTAQERLEAARSEVALSEDGLGLARAELEQARHRFEAGVSTNIELVNAQEELAKAEEGHLDARYRLNQAQADLAHARGELETRYAR